MATSSVLLHPLMRSTHEHCVANVFINLCKSGLLKNFYIVVGNWIINWFVDDHAWLIKKMALSCYRLLVLNYR